MIFTATATTLHISAPATAARSLPFAWPGSDLLRRPRAKSRRGAPPPLAETYEILTLGRPIRNRKLTRVGAKNCSSKESIMLDVAFVALGLAVLALMGVYALALRQL